MKRGNTVADLENTNEEYTPDIVDLDGEPFEVIDAITYDDRHFVALVKYTEEDEFNEDEEGEFIVLEEIEKDGEYMLSTIDDEELYTEVGDAFITRFDQMFSDDITD